MRPVQRTPFEEEILAVLTDAAPKKPPGHKPPPARVPGLTPAQADAALKRALKNQRRLLQLRKGQLQRWNAKDQKQFKTWFGVTDKASRQKISTRIDRELALNKSMTLGNFKRNVSTDPTLKAAYAYVYPNDKSHIIYIGDAFAKARAIGEDSQAGTLAHEMSHFNSVSGTKDYVYGAVKARLLATKKPARALMNADSFEYFIEGVK